MLSGKVREYDPARGFGFVVTDGGVNFFFHISAHNGGHTRRVPMEGDYLNFEAEKTEKGDKAVRWAFASAGLQRGTVKFFDTVKGFGFILNPEPNGKDIFIHGDNIRSVIDSDTGPRFATADGAWHPRRDEEVLYQLHDNGGKLRASAWGPVPAEQAAAA